MEISCPGCQQTLRVSDGDAGRKARCPKCETVFSIPQLSGSSASDAGNDTGSDAAGLADQGSAVERSGSSQFSAPDHPTSGGDDPFGRGSSTAEPRKSDFSVGGSEQEELWHLRIEDGRTFGPVPRAELDQWCAENRITATCFLRRQSESNWLEAGRVYPQLGAPGPVSTNPFRDDLSPQQGLHGSYAQQSYRQAHRGGVILAFGILGLFGCGCIFFVGFAIAAWSMGTTDLKAMTEGRMDESGRNLTQTGQIMGMIGCGITVISILFFFFGNAVNL